MSPKREWGVEMESKAQSPKELGTCPWCYRNKGKAEFDVKSDPLCHEQGQVVYCCCRGCFDLYSSTRYRVDHYGLKCFMCKEEFDLLVDDEVHSVFCASGYGCRRKDGLCCSKECKDKFETYVKCYECGMSTKHGVYVEELGYTLCSDEDSYMYSQSCYGAYNSIDKDEAMCAACERDYWECERGFRKFTVPIEGGGGKRKAQTVCEDCVESIMSGIVIKECT